jgi:hypothetical protein
MSFACFIEYLQCLIVPVIIVLECVKIEDYTQSQNEEKGPARTGQAEHDSTDRTARTGKAGQDRTAQPG